MIKNKFFVVFIAAFFLNFCLNNESFGIEPISIQSKYYPDYAYEFTGRDKCENFNRKIFIFNSKVNKCLVRPINTVWASVMPKCGMEKVQNFYTNLEYPIRLMGCLLQNDYSSSRKETLRFLTNTTLGIGGLYDPAKTRFKIEPRDEDVAQALAYHHVKQGPYLVLPIIASGNLRDLAGQLLDCPLNPTSYVIGPVALVAKSISVINKTTFMQSLFKAIDCTYADPYQITKELQGVDKYIKNVNLDRKEVLAEKTASQDIIKISHSPDELGLESNLKADIKLNDYNPQSPAIDSMRTALFDDPSLVDPVWSDLSVWNRNFSKRIKTGSVNIDPKRPNYKYRYILQKNKTAPLAIIYPSFGEGIMSYHSVVLAKMFYDEGYSVLIQGCTFQWEFVKSMPDNYRPGILTQDAHYAKLVTSKIVDNFENQKDSKNAYHFDKKILVGTSFGALTTLFVAAQEEKDKSAGIKTLDISKYIAVCPPVDILFAEKQVDKYAQDWKNKSGNIKMRAAITAEKVLQVSHTISDKNIKKKPETLPFTEDEARLIVGFIMKQKLSDIIFTIEKSSTSKKSDFYQTVSNMSFDDYVQKYIQENPKEPLNIEQLEYNTSLYSLADFLQKNEKYKIYHSVNDYFVNSEQLIWLKEQANNKAVFFNNGSHLGFLYRKEFIDELKKDIKLQDTTPKDETEVQVKI